MKQTKWMYTVFAVIAGLLSVSCIYNLFRPDRKESILSLLILLDIMAPISILCAIKAKKAADVVKKSGGDMIVKTKIVDSYGKTSTASAAVRGTVGNAVAGPVGAIVGASTAKVNRSTTFLIFYKSGRKTTKTVPNNSLEYQKYIKYLE